MIRAIQLLIGFAAIIGGGALLWYRPGAENGLFDMTNKDGLWMAVAGLVLALFGLMLMLMGVSSRAKVSRINRYQPKPAPAFPEPGRPREEFEDYDEAILRKTPAPEEEPEHTPNPDFVGVATAVGAAALGAGGVAAAQAFSDDSDDRSGDEPEFSGAEEPSFQEAAQAPYSEDRPRFTAADSFDDTPQIVDNDLDETDPMDEIAQHMDADLDESDIDRMADEVEALENPVAIETSEFGTPEYTPPEEETAQSEIATEEFHTEPPGEHVAAYAEESTDYAETAVTPSSEEETETAWLSTPDIATDPEINAPVEALDESYVEAFEAESAAYEAAPDDTPAEAVETPNFDELDDQHYEPTLEAQDEELISQADAGWLEADDETLEPEAEHDPAAYAETSDPAEFAAPADIEPPAEVLQPETEHLPAEEDTTPEEAFTAAPLADDILQEAPDVAADEAQSYEPYAAEPESELPEYATYEAPDSAPQDFEAAEEYSAEEPALAEISEPDEPEDVNSPVPEMTHEELAASDAPTLDEPTQEWPSPSAFETSPEADYEAAPIEEQDAPVLHDDIPDAPAQETETAADDLAPEILAEAPEYTAQDDGLEQAEQILEDDSPVYEEEATSEVAPSAEHVTAAPVAAEYPAQSAEEDAPSQDIAEDSSEDDSGQWSSIGLGAIAALGTAGVASQIRDEPDANASESSVAEPPTEPEPTEAEATEAEAAETESAVSPIDEAVSRVSESLEAVAPMPETPAEEPVESAQDEAPTDDEADIEIPAAATTETTHDTLVAAPPPIGASMAGEAPLQSIVESETSQTISGTPPSFDNSHIVDEPASRTTDGSGILVSDFPVLGPVIDALSDGKLDEADQHLARIRRDLIAKGDENTAELAALTALAGDHAEAAGRLGGAKWLWRLALQRFQEAEAADTVWAEDVQSRLDRVNA